MRPLGQDPTQAELMSSLDKLKQQLKPQVLDEVMNQGLRDSMITEYGELAANTSALIRLLRESGVANILLGRAAEDYAQILARFSVSGQRFQLLIDESCAIDETALLAIAGDGPMTVN